MAEDRFLTQRIQEELEWMEDNMGGDPTADDAIDHLLGECGRTQSGDCMHAGSEYCDFECPFSR